MDEAAEEFLRQILETPSPSGYEQPVQTLVRSYCEGFADRVETDVHGNVIAIVNPEAPTRLMLAGHCDQIGLIVTHIDDSGFIYTQPIGGWDPLQLIGQRMTIWAAEGPVHGVIARKPIHLLEADERKAAVKQQDLWIDVGAANQAEAAELVRVGDPVTLRLGMQKMRHDLANAPGMDNKTGLWIVLEAARRAAARGDLDCAICAVSTVQEEIGLRGARTSAYSVNPHVGIAVDVTHATDCPTIDRRQRGDVRIGGGPVIFRGPNMNPRVSRRLIELAEKQGIDHQVAAIGRGTPNDANALQISRSGVATGLVATPNRYMHSAVELVSLKDLDRSADLLAAFAKALAAEEDFTP